MSTGNKRQKRKSDAEIFRMVGLGDTPELLAKPVSVSLDYDVPYGAGVSVDGRTVYIDRRLRDEVARGKVACPGMSGRDIIRAWIEHEHTEKAVDDGDNPVDTYQGAHAFALGREERFVKLLGADPDQYDDCIAAGLKRALARSIENPPRDLWCGPYLDEPTARDEEILHDFRQKGVEDAFKLSKIEVHYTLSAYKCRDCRHYGGARVRDKCEIVSGLVRADRHCDRWEAKR